MTLQELKSKAAELNIDTETVKGYGKLSAKATWELAINDREIEMMVAKHELSLDDAEMAETIEENALIDAEDEEETLEAGTKIIVRAKSIYDGDFLKVCANEYRWLAEKLEYRIYGESTGQPYFLVLGFVFESRLQRQLEAEGIYFEVYTDEIAVNQVEENVANCSAGAGIASDTSDYSDVGACRVFSTQSGETYERLNHAMPMVLMITAVFIVCYQVYYGLYVPVRRWTVPRAKAIWRDLYSLVNMVDVGFIIQ